ncbi:hypothetical protein N430_03135 [Pseudomonas sp. CC120222-01a]|nr:hypothetical protein N430_03135 [Pseudomonas sp. CC120222-01a]
MHLLVQAIAYGYYLRTCDAVRIIEIVFLSAYLQKFTEVVLPRLQKATDLIVQRNYFSNEFKFASLPGFVEFGLAFRAAQARSVDKAL